MKPLRSVSECYIEIIGENGETVFTNSEFDIPKSYVEDGKLVHALIGIWDGGDGINDRFVWEDGAYTARLTFVSYLGGSQSVEIPLTVDTEDPAVENLYIADGVLTASFTDNHYIRSVSVFAPDPDGGDGEYLFYESVEPEYEEGVHTAEIEAEIGEGLQYVYVRAEDYAGNVTWIRQYV